MFSWQDIPKVSDKDFSITLNAYFNVKWRDPRLIVSKDYSKEGPPPKVMIIQPDLPSQLSFNPDSLTHSMLVLKGFIVFNLTLTDSLSRHDMTSKNTFHFKSTDVTGKYQDNIIKLMKVYFQDMTDEDPSLTPINLHILRNLWLPDVEILDLKAFETHSVLSKLEGRRILFICHMWLKGKITKWQGRCRDTRRLTWSIVVFLFNWIYHLLCVNKIMTVRLARQWRGTPTQTSKIKINSKQIRISTLIDSSMKNKLAEFGVYWNKYTLHHYIKKFLSKTSW